MGSGASGRLQVGSGCGDVMPWEIFKAFWDKRGTTVCIMSVRRVGPFCCCNASADYHLVIAVSAPGSPLPMLFPTFPELT